jgi:hypothetical protein
MHHKEYTAQWSPNTSRDDTHLKITQKEQVPAKLGPKVRYEPTPSLLFRLAQEASGRNELADACAANNLQLNPALGSPTIARESRTAHRPILYPCGNHTSFQDDTRQ